MVIGGGKSLHPDNDGLVANYDELLEGAHPYDATFRNAVLGSGTYGGSSLGRATQGGSMFLSPYGYLQRIPGLITIPKVGIVDGGSMNLSPYTPPPPPPPPAGVTGGFSPLLIGMLAPAVFSLAKKVLGGSLNIVSEPRLAEDGTIDHPTTIVFRHRNGSIDIKPINPHKAYITLHQSAGDGPPQGLSIMNGQTPKYIEGSGLLLGENSPFKGWPIIGQLL